MNLANHKVLALNDAKNRSESEYQCYRTEDIRDSRDCKFKVSSPRPLFIDNGQIHYRLWKDGRLCVRETLLSLSPAEVLIHCRKDATLKAVQLEALVRVHRVRMQHP